MRYGMFTLGIGKLMQSARHVLNMRLEENHLKEALAYELTVRRPAGRLRKRGEMC